MMGAFCGRRWISLLGSGCQDESDPLRSPCGPLPEWTCLKRSAGPCSPLATVQLESRALASACPEGSTVRRAVEPPAVCAPAFTDFAAPGLRHWLMTSVAGFGDTIFVRAAFKPDGAWYPAIDVHKCKLPSNDPDAFCDSARLVPALFDPERPTHVVLTYRIDSLAPDREARIAARPSDYRPQMVWVDVERFGDEVPVRWVGCALGTGH